jgi:23S rRNA pseudouridine1911/1915/1917 synthase
VKAYIKEKYAKPGGVYLGVPHRLDRPVSGVVCFARNTKAAQRVHAQFEQHRVKKVYWALVEGAVAPEAGVWDDWIRKVEDEPRVERAAEGQPGAKLATLEFRVLRALPDATHLELRPLTGRMHQLRVQTAWRGHPVSATRCTAANGRSARPRNCHATASSRCTPAGSRSRTRSRSRSWSSRRRCRTTGKHF